MTASRKPSKTPRTSIKPSVKPSNTPRRTGKGSEGLLQTNDVGAEQARAAHELAAAIPFNAAKKTEYGHGNALIPPTGATAAPASDQVTASTNSEENTTVKTGGPAVVGGNASIASLDRVRVDAGGQVLTTNQGVPIADNQSSLKAGLRGPTLLEDFILREKITHFDHERIPERIVHARGSGAHGYFEAYDALTKYTRAAPFATAGKITPVFVRFGLQLFTEDQSDGFSFDVLDATKLVPEELVPVLPVGRMVLNRNPDNFFAETEQVAFCPADVILGIDGSAFRGAACRQVRYG